ncbi:unnamed protein product [Spodoptera exigua]|nr:unnamed protein product [Spodoptera exigua]
MGANPLRQFDGLLQQFINWEHTAHETHSFGFGSVNEVAGENNFHCLGFANVSGQTLGTTSPGNGSNVDLWLSEFGFLASVNNIAEHSQLATAAQSESINSCDDRFSTVGHIFPVLEESLLRVVAESVVLHLLDVSAGSESLLITSNDDGSNLLISVEVPHGLAELHEEWATQSIKGLRPVELDQTYILLATNNFYFDVFICWRSTIKFNRTGIGSCHSAHHMFPQQNTGYSTDGGHFLYSVLFNDYNAAFLIQY